MSGNGDSWETDNGRSDSSSTTTSSSSSTSNERTRRKRQKAIAFPGRHANGAAHVYRKDLCYRDNSSVLETFFNHEDNALCFTRPMQLGKSILFSLANEVFSRNERSNVDSHLSYSPGKGDRNKWYVLRVNFGVVSNSSGEGNWEMRCKALDEEAASEIRLSVLQLLLSSGNEELFRVFKQLSENKKVGELPIGTLIRIFTHSLNTVCGRLLILVDEYDQPIREGILSLMPQHSAGLYAKIKAKITKDCFPNYFGFFSAVKVALDDHAVEPLKIWLTGILPIAIKEMSGLNVVHITFSHAMANAVGLTNRDVQRMMDQVNDKVPFQDGERDRATSWLQQLNRLGFPGGEPLYHTALINGIMNRLQDDRHSRREFIDFGRVPTDMSKEPVSSVIFDVLCTARNLRHVVNKLVAEGQLKGYRLNYEFSLEHLLQPTIDIEDYLTLLVHVGVLSVSEDKADARITTFKLTSKYYCKHLLDPILKTLKASLEKLVSYTSTEDIYCDGEDILVDFVTSISKTNMARLMAWASSDSQNHILELQFQAQIVTEAHDILNGVAQPTQEDRLLPGKGKRTDITFSSPTSVVVLELRQISEGAPSAALIAKAHEQLAQYVGARLQMEAAGRKRPVAGFVLIMYDDGASYVVQKMVSFLS